MVKRVSLIGLVTAIVVCCGAVTSAIAGGTSTSIDGGPMGPSVDSSPTFTFSNESAAGFECSLDGGPFAGCTSPMTVGPLALGHHALTVRATFSDGSADPAPARQEWDVVPPITTPTVRLSSRRTLKVDKLRQLRGTAAAPSGVKRVQLALTYGPHDRDYFPPACHYVDLSLGSRVMQPCLLPLYVTVSGTRAWHYAVPRRVRATLQSGRYTLIVRAFNGYNEAARQEFKLTLR
jgi:hypothetical protein